MAQKNSTETVTKIRKEFKNKAPCDGIILYSRNNKDEIIKIKPLSLLTVDLQYDGNDIFLDADGNCYAYRPKPGSGVAR